MKNSFLALLTLVLADSAVSPAATIYNNTTTDTLITYFYSAGGFSQIGDSVTLAGTERILDTAAVQFFNNGPTGTFSATLSFWNTGSPVGSQIGSSYVLNGLAINNVDILTVTFSGLNLLVPDNIVFTVAVSNLSNGTMDLGLNAFEPPSPGSSNNAAIITRVGAGAFATGNTAAGEGNLYLRLEASPVPEPSTLLTMAGGAVLLVLGARRRK